METLFPILSSFGQYLHEAKFQYSDCLDDQHLRLLELKFGHTDETICVDIQTYPIDNHPPYIALSYAWGNPNHTVNILCNGKSIAVTQNLKDALWQFRENRKRLTRLESSESTHGELLHFWVDAICIDQACNQEKSFQVGMMANIYQQARHVFTWLGRADKSSNIAIRCINNIVKIAEDSGIEPGPSVYYNIWHQMLFVPGKTGKILSFENTIREVDGSLSRGSFKALKDLFDVISGSNSQDNLLPIPQLHDFFHRPWWSRIWVLQEIALSRDTHFICGTQSIPRTRYVAFFHVFESLYQTLSTACSREHQCLNKYQAGILLQPFHRRPFLLLHMPDVHRRTKCELIDLLRLTSKVSQDGAGKFEATRPEDRIFALLGLAADQEELKRYGLVPNYGISYQQTYAITMAALLQQGHTYLLSMCQAPRLPGLPSWAPDWFRKSIATLQCPAGDFRTMEPAFSCSGNRSYRKSAIKVLNDDGTIKRISIKSYLYDEVYQVGHFNNRCDKGGFSSTQMMEWPKVWLLEILRLSYCRRKDYKGFHNRLHACTRTCIGDVGWSRDGKQERLGNDQYLDAIAILSLGIQLIGKSRLKIDAHRFLNSLDSHGFPNNLDALCFSARQTGICKCENMAEHLNQLSKNIWSQSPGRLPFVTSKGHLGLSSQHIKPGDAIAIIEGSQVPFALRRQDKGQFSLISEAYVDGIMDGEAASTGDFRYITLV